MGGREGVTFLCVHINSYHTFLAQNISSVDIEEENEKDDKDESEYQ